VKLFIHQLVLISICNQSILSIEEKRDYIFHLCKKLCKNSRNNTEFFQKNNSITKVNLSKEKIIYPFNKLLELYDIGKIFICNNINLYSYK